MSFEQFAEALNSLSLVVPQVVRARRSVSIALTQSELTGDSVGAHFPMRP